VKAYVVYCHPDPDSFTSAICRRAVDSLQSAGHEVRVSDLYADGFDPAMSVDEVRDHLGPPEHKPGVAEYCDNLQWCETIVFIYPTWWSGQPAMLTGWLDRVLIRGVAWDLPDGATRIERRLTNVRRLVAVTTHGSSKFINLLEGETGRSVIGRAVRLLCHRTARSTWLALYGIDRSTAPQREAFLDRVESRLGRR
jgi:NAD(P)H dehydrogenase (quinone)